MRAACLPSGPKWRSSVLVALLLAGCPKPGGPPAEPIEPVTLEQLEEAGRAPLETAEVLPAPETLITGGTVMTAAGQILTPGWVHLLDGHIAEVGEGEPPAVPGALIVDATGRFVTPGLIDTHSHLGVYPSPGARAHGDGNEATSPTTGGVWAEHSVWPQDPGLERAVAGGVTTMQVLPGSANLIGGRGVVLHLVPTRGSRAMRFPGAPETLKMACGENPKRVYGEHRNSAPSTRMGNLRGQREAFIQAQRYLDDWDRYAEKVARYNEKGGDEPPRPPERDLELETLAGVLEGRVLPQVHCYRADDMISFLQLADEFGFTIRSFHHALEAYKIRDILAEADVASSTWADWWGFKLEAYDGVPANAAMLESAGARAIIHSDSAIGIQRLNQEAAKARRSGDEVGLPVSEDAALRWITLNPAWALGIDDQVGSLEAGKRADIVVWSGNPFSVYSQADLVFIDGALRFDRAQRVEPWSDFEVGWEVAP
ncbi:MAG: amidohydrolase [Alphaproteobacteria bacterium]|nr:amidohydrolase [Alphaproteobacteria bacterium]